MEHFLHLLRLKTVNLWPNKWNLRLITQQSVTNYCDYEILNYLVIWSLYDILIFRKLKICLKGFHFESLEDAEKEQCDSDTEKYFGITL
jgi:hypothetical protein